MNKAEAVCSAAARVLAPLAVSEDIPLGLSIGVAVYEPGCPEAVSELLGRGDRAMYGAKRGGKGRVVLAPSAAEEPTP